MLTQRSRSESAREGVCYDHETHGARSGADHCMYTSRGNVSERFVAFEKGWNTLPRYHIARRSAAFRPPSSLVLLNSEGQAPGLRALKTFR
jgi:hypothetical protein